MIDGLIYLLNVNMALAILYLCYRTVRNNSYLFVRRICLWGILMISFGFPFINELFIIPLPDPSLNSVSHVVSSVWNTQKQITSIDVQDKDNWFLIMVMIIYVLGLVYFLLRFFYSILQLHRKLRTAAKDIWSGITVWVVQGKGDPFCLGRRIYVYEESKKDPTVLLKLVHEKVHAENLHTIDIWTFQLVSIVNWFNPFVWMLSRDTRFLLECIADRLTIKTTGQKYAYFLALSEKETMEQHFLYAPFAGVTQTSRLLFLLNNSDKRIRNFVLIFLAAFFILLIGTLKQQIYNRGSFFDWNNLYIKKELPCSGNLVDQSKHMIDYKIISSIPIGPIKSVNNIFERIIINDKLAKGYVELYIKIEPDGWHSQVYISFSSNKSYDREAINLALEWIKRESEWIKYTTLHESYIVKRKIIFDDEKNWY